MGKRYEACYADPLFLQQGSKEKLAIRHQRVVVKDLEHINTKAGARGTKAITHHYM